MEHFEIRGVVEGFYGRPWTFEERKEIVGFLAKNRCNIYLYAPKNDPFHRDRWREPYSDEFFSNFRELVTVGNEAGVDIGFAVSPGLSVVYCKEKEVELLQKKLQAFCDIGVCAVGLFFDDIPLQLTNQADREHFSSLASAQAAVSNRVFSRLFAEYPELKAIVCPTLYHGDPDNEYLIELGALLNEKIMVFWTGPEVCSKTIPKDDAERVYGILKKPILYWDNYPVNDATMVPEMHIGPYVGRDPKIVRYASGMLLNPMNQAHASMISLGAAARYLNNPMEYDPTVAWMVSIGEICPDYTDDLLHFAEYNMQSPLHPSEPKEPQRIVEDFRIRFKQGDWSQAIGILFEESERIITGAANLREHLPTDIGQELSPWLNEYEKLGKILDMTGKLIWESSALYSDEPRKDDMQAIDSQIELLEKALKGTADRRTVIGGSFIQNLALDTMVRIKGLFTLSEGKCLHEYDELDTERGLPWKR